MNRTVLAAAIGATLLGSVTVLAQGQQGQGQQAPQHPMTFFVASGVPGTGV